MASSIDRVDHNQSSNSDTRGVGGDDRSAQEATGQSAAAANKAQDLKPADTKTGDDKSTEAVSQANKQQDAGQNWQQFADKQQDVSSVPSVNDIAAQQALSDQQEENKREQVKAANLQFDMAVQQSKIRC